MKKIFLGLCLIIAFYSCQDKTINEVKEVNSKPIAEKHFNVAFPNISNDDYMGSHWLGSFALQALDAQ